MDLYGAKGKVAPVIGIEARESGAKLAGKRLLLDGDVRVESSPPPADATTSPADGDWRFTIGGLAAGHGKTPNEAIESLLAELKTGAIEAHAESER